MLKKLCRYTASLLVGVLLTTGLGLVQLSSTALAQDKGKVKLALRDYTGHHITTIITGNVLEDMGYEVEYIPVGQAAMFQGIADGSLDLNMEFWSLTAREKYEGLRDSGQLIELGLIGFDGRETWYYPSYLAQDCPGLPDWQALNGCAELFSQPETFPNGRLVDYPQDWNPSSPRIIEALDLDYVAVPSGGEGPMIAEIKSAFTRQEPLMVMFWKPHWVFGEYDLTAVDFPEWEMACEEDPSWGVNPGMTWDCASPTPRVVKFSRPGLDTDMPEVFALAKEVVITEAVQAGLMAKIDRDGIPAKEAVAEWVAANEDVWRPWVNVASM